MTASTHLTILAFLFMSTCPIAAAQAQPYPDLAQLSYHTSPGNDPKEFKHLRAQVNTPIVFKDSSIFLFNPIWEERWVKIQESDGRSHYRGAIAWFTYSRKIHGIRTRWILYKGNPAVQDQV